MMMVEESDDIESVNYVTFEPVYNYNDRTKNKSFTFVFDVLYTEAPEPDSDGEEPDYDSLPKLPARRTRVFDKNWLFRGNKKQMKANVRKILEMIDVPCYRDVVSQLTREIMSLKVLDMEGDWYKVESINVGLDIVVYELPDGNLDVRMRLTAPAA